MEAANADTLELILKCLPPASLRSAELVSREFRTAASEDVWAEVASRIVRMPTMPPHHWDERFNMSWRLIWKRFCWFVEAAPADGPVDTWTSNLAVNILASSEDTPTQGAGNLLEMSLCDGSQPGQCRCGRGVSCHWSSAPIEVGDTAQETLTCWLKRAGWSLVHQLSLKPFQAWFHLGHPVYAPREATVSVQRGSAEMEAVRSPSFPRTVRSACLTRERG